MKRLFIALCTIISLNTYTVTEEECFFLAWQERYKIRQETDRPFWTYCALRNALTNILEFIDQNITLENKEQRVHLRKLKKQSNKKMHIYPSSDYQNFWRFITSKFLKTNLNEHKKERYKALLTGYNKKINVVSKILAQKQKALDTTIKSLFAILTTDYPYLQLTKIEARIFQSLQNKILEKHYIDSTTFNRPELEVWDKALNNIKKNIFIYQKYKNIEKRYKKLYDKYKPYEKFLFVTQLNNNLPEL